MALVHHVMRTRLHVFPADTRYEELAAVGYLALCNCAMAWDKKRKIKFITYAFVGVLRFMLRWLHENRLRGLTPKTIGRIPVTELPDTVSLTAMVDGGYDYAGKPDEMGDCLNDQRLRMALAVLPERLRSVIRARFFADQTLEEIGNVMGITKERVRQLEREALRELARNMN